LTRIDARRAFTFGYVILFLLLVLLTWAYAVFFLLDSQLATPVLVLFVHLIAQSGYTVGVHVRELNRAFASPVVAAITIGLLIIAALMINADSVQEPLGLLREQSSMILNGDPVLWYRYIISCYGLVFPAYVWLCMIPTASGHHGTRGRLGGRKLAVWLVVVAAASPFFWLGFIARQEHYLLGGMAVILGARAVVMMLDRSHASRVRSSDQQPPRLPRGPSSADRDPRPGL